MILNSFAFLCLGKGEEQRAAATLACLLFIQLGSGIESEELFKTLKPLFKSVMNDGSANIQTRQAVSRDLIDKSVTVVRLLYSPCTFIVTVLLFCSVQCATSLGLCTLVAEDDITVGVGICFCNATCCIYTAFKLLTRLSTKIASRVLMYDITPLKGALTNFKTKSHAVQVKPHPDNYLIKLQSSRSHQPGGSEVF